jgi:hypothetical protein
MLPPPRYTLLSYLFRLGNLLLEMATLYLVGEEVGQPVYLLPQVAAKLRPYFSSLPLPVLDHR